MLIVNRNCNVVSKNNNLLHHPKSFLKVVLTALTAGSQQQVRDGCPTKELLQRGQQRIMWCFLAGGGVQ